MTQAQWSGWPTQAGLAEPRKARSKQDVPSGDGDGDGDDIDGQSDSSGILTSYQLAKGHLRTTEQTL